MNRQEALAKSERKTGNSSGFGNKNKETSSYVERAIELRQNSSISDLGSSNASSSVSSIDLQSVIMLKNNEIDALQNETSQLKLEISKLKKSISNRTTSNQNSSYLSDQFFTILGLGQSARNLFKVLWPEFRTYNLKNPISKSEICRKHNITFLQWKDGLQQLSNAGILDIESIKEDGKRYVTYLVFHPPKK